MEQHKIRVNKVLYIGKREISSRYNDIVKARRALHEEIEIKYFYEGSLTLVIGTETYNVSKGDIIVVNPYEFHATLDCESNKGKYIIFMVPLDFFQSDSDIDFNLRNFLLTEKNIFKTLVQNEQMAQILINAANESEQKKPFSALAIKGLLMEFFCRMLRDYTISPDSNHLLQNETLRYYKLIEPALRCIRDNYPENFTVERLADLCGLSKHYFCRVFKNVTSKTTMEYLREYRIKVSEALLSNTDKSIGQIAEQCGFESVNYYCRCYKNYYGVSPGKRRNGGGEV